jgi:hypothetical protein
MYRIEANGPNGPAKVTAEIEALKAKLPEIFGRLAELAPGEHIPIERAQAKIMRKWELKHPCG